MAVEWAKPGYNHCFETGMFRRYLHNNNHAKVMANSLYVYAIHLFHVLTNLLPAFMRVPCFRPLLRRCGKKVFLDHNVYIKFPWLVEIGSAVSINRGVEIYSGFFSKSMVRIGSGVRIGPHARLLSEGHETESGQFLHTGKTITVEDGVWIGANVVVLPGVTIGKGSVIGAGSVVTRDVPPHTLAVGNPALPKKTFPCGEGGDA